MYTYTYLHALIHTLQMLGWHRHHDRADTQTCLECLHNHQQLLHFIVKVSLGTLPKIWLKISFSSCWHVGPHNQNKLFILLTCGYGCVTWLNYTQNATHTTVVRPRIHPRTQVRVEDCQASRDTWMSLVTHMNESCYTHECVMSHVWMSPVKNTNESCPAWLVTLHIWISHSWPMNTSCHVYKCHTYEIVSWMSHITHEWVTSDLWIHHVMYTNVTRMDTSCLDLKYWMKWSVRGGNCIYIYIYIYI